jgi:hypothetical protein
MYKGKAPPPLSLALDSPLGSVYCFLCFVSLSTYVAGDIQRVGGYVMVWFCTSVSSGKCILHPSSCN